MKRTPLWTGVASGVLAGVAMLLSLLAFRLALGAPSLLEMGSDWFTRALPPRLFSWLLDTLLTAGKPLLYLGEMVVMLAAAVGVGVLYANACVRWPRLNDVPWRGGAVVGLAVFLVIDLLVAPVFGVGAFGLSALGGALSFIVATLGYSLVFGLALAYLCSKGVPAAVPDTAVPLSGRRAFLRRALLWAGGIALIGGAGRLVIEAVGRATPSRYTSTRGAMPPNVTPNSDFYTVSKNILDPIVDGTAWTLTIDGLVDHPFTLKLSDLRAMDAIEQYVTLECISNPVGGELISNALWRGTPLRRLLDQAGLRGDVRRMVFHSIEGYTDTLPVDDARREAVMVAYEMNGQPLPREHGHPARLLVPGRYGMKSVKWLTRIEATDKADVRGFWQERGWDDEAVVKTMSRVSLPADGASLQDGATLLGGVAFAGGRGIRRVEVSADDGRTWLPAVLGSALSTYTWVLWTTEWDPPAPGRYSLQVRATDGMGTSQTMDVLDMFPTGATGYHGIRVTVS